jgi:hypothetical protein
LAELVDIEKKTINKIGFEWNEKGK